MSIIALLTDFGNSDWYVASMKGAILNEAPQTQIVDITHSIAPYDIVSGAFQLLVTSRTFPAGSIFCAVVDPGVGGSREIVIGYDEHHYFVAPDNGILSPIAEQAGEKWQSWHVSNFDLFKSEVSSTFHGRDIMAPIAGQLSRGVAPDFFGVNCQTAVQNIFNRPQISDDRVELEIIYIDHFGNLFTNLSQSMFEDEFCDRGAGPSENWKLFCYDKSITGLSKTFSDRNKGELLFYWGSAGYLEIAVNQGSAAEYLSVLRGEKFQMFL